MELQLTGLASSRPSQIALSGSLGAVLGMVIASKPTMAVAALGAVLGAIAVLSALNYPERTFVGLVLVLALIPTYAAPSIGPLLFIPAAGLSWLVAGALAWRNAIDRGRIMRPTAIDLAVLLFAGLMFVSLSFSAQVESDDFLNALFAWGGPFLAARLLLEEVAKPARLLAASFALAMVLIAPVAILESMGWRNPFLSLQYNAVESAVWSPVATRLGSVRAEASFGHPIALSVFVATSALLSLAMAIYSRGAKERAGWLALALVACAVQALTYSRTGWLMLAIGIVLLGASVVARRARRWLKVFFAAVATLAVGLVALGSVPAELQLFPSGGGGEEGAAFVDSGAYREALLDRALEPGVLHAWGNPVNMVTPAVSADNTATDNAYIILADHWGLIPTGALALVALLILLAIVLARRRKVGEDIVLPIAAFAGLCGLFFVAFVTQQQLTIWLLIGAAGAASARMRPRRRADDI